MPMKKTLFKKEGRVKKEIEPLFPGYVFIESYISSLEFQRRTGYVISSSNDILRLLQYGDEDDIAMREGEKIALLNLLNDDHCIEPSLGIIEGDQVCIKDGPLVGWESKLKKIDRHKRQALIDIEVMGYQMRINAALEIVQKI